MNPRQRRGLVTMLIAGVVALATFLLVSAYVASVNSQVGQRVTVYRATAPIEAYSPITANNVEPVEVPKKWAPESSILKLSDLQGRRVGFRLNAGTTLSSDMLIPTSSLQKGEREIAINVNAVTGVAGRVRPGDKVDVIAVFADVPGLAKQVRVIDRDVRVVSIAGQQTVTQTSEAGIKEQEVIPVTLAVSQPVSMAIAYATNFAKEVSLVALPTDVGVSRKDDIKKYDAKKLGGNAIKEQ